MGVLRGLGDLEALGAFGGTRRVGVTGMMEVFWGFSGSLRAVHFWEDFEVWEVGSLGKFRKLVMEGFGGVGDFWGGFCGGYGFFGEEFWKGWGFFVGVSFF